MGTPTCDRVVILQVLLPARPSDTHVTDRCQCETARHEAAKSAAWMLSNVGLDRESEDSHGVYQRANTYRNQNDRQYRDSEGGEQELEDYQQTAHEQIVDVRLQQLLVAWEHLLHERRRTNAEQTPRKHQRDRQAETPATARTLE